MHNKNLIVNYVSARSSYLTINRNKDKHRYFMCTRAGHWLSEIRAAPLRTTTTERCTFRSSPGDRVHRPASLERLAVADEEVEEEEEAIAVHFLPLRHLQLP